MNIEMLLTLLLSTAFPLMVVAIVFRNRRPRSGKLEVDQATLQAAEQELAQNTRRDWVVLKRFHGPAYSHTALSEIVIQLQAEGIEATYDVIGTSSAEGGVTNFMLKVREGQQEMALEVLAKLEESPS